MIADIKKLVKPKNVYRDRSCRWSTPYDVMANQITEQLQGRRSSCGMGIWNTIKRCNSTPAMLFDDFMALEEPVIYLESVKQYYERQLTIPDNWKDVWDAPFMKQHFLMDCKFMYEHTKVVSLSALDYENLIFENGQGLLLCDTGKDAFDKTPSNTGILYSLELLKDIQDVDITAHYVTRPYLTRHGDGDMEDQGIRQRLSSSISEDRTNHFNELQGEFRYGKLDILTLQKRILSDVGSVKFELEVTHCDEMDLIGEFQKHFNIVNPYDTPLV